MLDDMSCFRENLLYVQESLYQRPVYTDQGIHKNEVGSSTKCRFSYSKITFKKTCSLLMQCLICFVLWLIYEIMIQILRYKVEYYRRLDSALLTNNDNNAMFWDITLNRPFSGFGPFIVIKTYTHRCCIQPVYYKYSKIKTSFLVCYVNKNSNIS